MSWANHVFDIEVKMVMIRHMHGPFSENIFFEKFEKPLPFFGKILKFSKKNCFTN
jgi:hypothetical protein